MSDKTMKEKEMKEKMMKRTVLSVLTVLAALVLANVADAALINYDGSTTTSRLDGPYTIGARIEIGVADITINALGVQDTTWAANIGAGGDDGFIGTPEVGLWSADGSTLIASATVTDTDTLIDSYRYVQLVGDVVLTANTQYIIGAVVGNGYEAFLDSSPAAFSGGTGVTILQSTFAAGGTVLTAPTTDGGTPEGRWAPANATYIIPEPATLGMVAAAACGILFIRRRFVI